MYKAPTAIVADDEANLTVYLCQLLQKLWPDLEVVATAANGKEALECIEKFTPDFAFLDIKMPLVSGLEVAANINGETRVIFVTAYDEYALEAFESAAVDYLVKPVELNRLSKTLDRLKSKQADIPDRKTLSDLVEKIVLDQSGKNTEYLSWIRAGLQGETKIISVNDIFYFKADHKYTSIFTVNGEFLIRKSIKDLARELDPKNFWQVHRSTIINVRNIDVAKKDFRGRYTVYLKGFKSGLKVSDPYSYLFRQM